MRKLLREIAKNRYEYLWVLPGLALVLFLTFYAAAFSIRISLFDYRLSTTVRPFVGLGNYVDLLFNDEAYWGSLGRSFLFLLLDVPLPIIFGLALALSLNNDIRFRPVFRSVFLLPWILSMVAAGYMMQWIFNDVSGIANFSIRMLGGKPLPWLSSSRLAFMTIVIADVWKTFPFSMVVLLAALQSIPVQLYEAARIDGASPFSQLRRITIPLLRSHIMILLILRSLRSFNMIDFIVVMTGGGPGTATQLLSFHMYQTAFTYFDLGRAAAMALTVLIINLILTFLYMRFVGTESHY